MIKNKTKSSKIKNSIEIINKILPDCIKDIQKIKRDFDLADCNGIKVAEAFSWICYGPVEIEIIEKWYWKWWVNAWTKRRYRNKVWLNSKNINRDILDIIETIGHELTHIADFYDNQHSFGHGNNYLKGKDGTAPVIMGRIFKLHAKRYLEGIANGELVKNN